MNTAAFLNAGPMLDVRVDDGVWWATCPGCPNWTVAADSWDDLFRLVAEWHAREAPHGAWRMVAPFVVVS